MDPIWQERLLFILFGFILGTFVTWMVTDAVARWKRGWGLVEVPEKTRVRHESEMRQAKSDRSQGCREIMRSIGCFIFVAIIIFIGAILLRALMQQSGG